MEEPFICDWKESYMNVTKDYSQNLGIHLFLFLRELGILAGMSHIFKLLFLNSCKSTVMQQLLFQKKCVAAKWLV